MSLYRQIFVITMALLMTGAAVPAMAAEASAVDRPGEAPAAAPTGPAAVPPVDVKYPPIAEVLELEHDFDVVAPGSTVDYAFIVRNNGIGELLIEEVSPG